MPKPNKSGLTGYSREERQAKSRTYEQNVRHSENSIRSEKVEHLLLLNDDGTIRFRASDGKEAEVTPTQEIIDNALDAVLTHNHPGGSCFSAEDIQTAMYMQVKEMRATTLENGTFALRRTHQTGVSPTPRYHWFPLLYREVRDNIHAAIQARIDNGTIPFDMKVIKREENEMSAKWLSENAQRFGWEFRWEGRK